MKNSVAEVIGKKVRGLKHCDKLIKKINEKGRTEIKLGNTGVSFYASRGDFLHTLLKSERSRLEHELNAIEISIGRREDSSERRMPAPMGASETLCECARCRTLFVKNSNRQKYCSVECRKADMAEK